MMISPMTTINGFGTAAPHNPLEQFEIIDWIPIHLGSLNASFTNSAFFMVLVVIVVSVFILGGVRRPSLTPGRWQSMVELIYEFIADMLSESAGPEARRFFPFIFTLFMFILIANLMGMIPYTFTVTSHIAVTFTLAAFIFIGVTVLGMFKNGFGFLRLFAPAGLPLPMLVVLVPIELISYMVRPISLSVRLFANMMAGHTMLKVIGGFVALIGVFGVFPVLVIAAFTALEVIIAVLQAYVFAMLTCIYLNDAYHPGH